MIPDGRGKSWTSGRNDASSAVFARGRGGQVTVQMTKNGRLVDADLGTPLNSNILVRLVFLQSALLMSVFSILSDRRSRYVLGPLQMLTQIPIGTGPYLLWCAQRFFRKVTAEVNCAVFNRKLEYPPPRCTRSLWKFTKHR